MGFSDVLFQYITEKSNLKLVWVDGSNVQIIQQSDEKQLTLPLDHIEEILTRKDHNQDEFLQLNLKGNRKLLVTKNLIGFKPAPILGLDLSRIPRVVTTLDLLHIVEAIEEVLSSEQQSALVELDVLKKVYLAIVYGGEQIGFEMDKEKRWLLYNFHPILRASA